VHLASPSHTTFHTDEWSLWALCADALDTLGLLRKTFLTSAELTDRHLVDRLSTAKDSVDNWDIASLPVTLAT
jgi:hypothetical protein